MYTTTSPRLDVQLYNFSHLHRNTSRAKVVDDVETETTAASQTNSLSENAIKGAEIAFPITVALHSFT